MNNQFDVINSLPKDIDKEEIVKVLNYDTEQRVLAQDWLRWVESFKKQYLKIGCVID
jgi:hypothetical protein